MYRYSSFGIVALLLSGCASTSQFTGYEDSAYMDVPPDGGWTVIASGEAMVMDAPLDLPPVIADQSLQSKTLQELADELGLPSGVSPVEWTPATESVTGVVNLTGNLIESDEPALSSYLVYPNETYRQAIQRWLHDSGYQQVGLFFEEPAVERALEKRVDRGFQIVNSLQDAIVEWKQLVAIASPDTSLENLTVDLVSSTSQAIVHDSLLPVRLHEVKAGLVKDAFVAMAKAYGWQANEYHYLPQEDYLIHFDYILVTRLDDVKSAMAELVEPYPALKVSLVPSTRQIYIESDKK